MKLYTYWRSQASYRVRIALRLKGLPFEIVPLDLLRGDQFEPSYKAVNAEMVVPSLIDGDAPPLVQSLAILEYLDEKHPEPPLLPRGLAARAHVRALAQTVAMDAHPFVVPRVRKYLEHELRADESARRKWIAHWLDEGSRAVEEMLARDARTGRFCCGDQPTIADICLAAHLVSAQMLCGRDSADYPTAHRILQNCLALEAFAAEHPLRQPEAQATAPI
jgi:maleylacetoacetate isomerase